MRKYLFDGDPPDGGIPANHVTSWDPSKPYDGSYFIMAGFNDAVGYKFEDPRSGGKANTWFQVKQPPGTKPGYDWNPSKQGYVVSTSLGGTRPAVPLYGVPGTEANGVLYEQATGRFYLDVPDAPGTIGTAGYPPGPTSGGVVTKLPIAAVEFSVADDGFWVAKTPAASAANKDGNPHPGISIINPGEWERVAGGMSINEALSLDDYKQAGWLGLDKHFLAWQGGDSAPAGEELASAMDAYTENNDQGAYRALRAVGVSPPKQKKGFNFGGDIGFHF